MHYTYVDMGKVLSLLKLAKHPHPDREGLSFDEDDIDYSEVDSEEESDIL